VVAGAGRIVSRGCVVRSIYGDFCSIYTPGAAHVPVATRCGIAQFAGDVFHQMFSNAGDSSLDQLVER